MEIKAGTKIDGIKDVWHEDFGERDIHEEEVKLKPLLKSKYLLRSI